MITSFLMLSTGSLAVAQDATYDNTQATPMPGLGHDYITSLNDTVNPADGSVTIQVTVPSPHERGINQPAYLYLYNSNGQYQFLTSYATGITSGPYRILLNGLTIAGTPNSYRSGSLIAAQAGDYIDFGKLTYSSISYQDGPLHSCYYTANYVYTDAQGGRHPLLDLEYMPTAYTDGEYCPYFGVPRPSSNQNQASDGVISAILDPNNGAGDAYVYDLHGDQLNPDYQVEDTNGNYLNTTNRAYDITYASLNSSYGTNQVQTTLSMPGITGQYVVNPGAGSVQTSELGLSVTPDSGNYYECPSTIPNAASSSNSKTTITLPNSMGQYSLTFDPYYNYPYVFTNPNGATVTYTWDTQYTINAAFFRSGSPTCSYTIGWPSLHTRTISYDGATPAIKETYEYAVTGLTVYGSWTSRTTTVTTTDLLTQGNPSFQTIYTYIPMSCSPTTSPVQTSCTAAENTITYKDEAGNTLKTVTKAWGSSNTINANQLAGVCTTLPSGQTSGIFYQYQGPGLTAVGIASNAPSDVAEYDYGTVTLTSTGACQQPSSTPSRETTTQYQTFANTPIVPGTNSINDRPASVTRYSNGTIISQTTYLYDKATVTNTTLPSIGHDETNYSGGSTAARGNVTSAKSVCNSSCTSATTQYSYDETGQVVQVTDPKLNVTTYSYGDNYSGDGSVTCPGGMSPCTTNAYRTLETDPTTSGVTHSRSFSYGYNDGKLWSASDYNGQTTQYCYYVGGCGGTVMDTWARLTGISTPDGGSSVITYVDTGSQPSMQIVTAVSSGASKTTTTTQDAYGHTLSNSAKEPNGSLDTVTMTYDFQGRVASKTNPKRSSPQPTDGTTYYTYDSLGRLLEQINQDGSKAWSCYDNIASISQPSCHAHIASSSGEWVDSQDENGNDHQTTTDALGRMTQVLEPAPGAAGTGGTPSMETDYAYDGNNNLLSVTQKGAGGSVARVRSFNYDSLSRLVCASNPENSSASCPATATGSYITGTTGYSYDLNGNITAKMSPQVNSTSGSTQTIAYCYDALNRMLYKAYTSSLNCVNPTSYAASYSYDQSTVGNAQYTNGKLTDEKSYAGSVLVSERQPYSYDKMGRLLQEYQYILPGTSTAKLISPGYRYDLAGDLVESTDGTTPVQSVNTQFPCSVSIPWTTLTLVNCYDSTGRVSSVTSNWGKYPTSLLSVSQTNGFTPAGQLQQWTEGTTSSGVPALSLTQSYTPRLWLQSITASGPNQ